jgi:hypothetical protein
MWTGSCRRLSAHSRRSVCYQAEVEGGSTENQVRRAAGPGLCQLLAWPQALARRPCCFRPCYPTLRRQSANPWASFGNSMATPHSGSRSSQHPSDHRTWRAIGDPTPERDRSVSSVFKMLCGPTAFLCRSNQLRSRLHLRVPDCCVNQQLRLSFLLCEGVCT